MKLSITDAAGFAPGFKLELDTPVFRLAQDALLKLDERGPQFLWEGASIPCVEMLSRVAGASALLVGWGQPNDNIHSPNESFSEVQFAKSKLWAESIFKALSGKEY
jgi:hypothetical protein